MPENAPYSIDQINPDTVIQALDQDMSPQDISAGLVQKFNLDPNETNQFISSIMTQEIERRKSVQVAEPEPQEPFSIQDTVQRGQDMVQRTMGVFFDDAQIPEEGEMDLSEFTATADALTRESMDIPTMIRGGFSPEAMAKASSDQTKLNMGIAAIAQKYGLPVQFNPETNEVGQFTAEGAFEPLDVDFFDTVEAGKYELGGAIAGASRGAAIPGPLPIKAAGAAVFGALGAAAGRGADINAAAKALQQVDDLSTAKVFNQMKQAGIDDATFTAILGPAFNLGAKGVRKAWDFVSGGDSSGARRALKDIMGLDQTQVDEIVELFEKHTTGDLPKSKAAQEIEAIGMTQPGGETFAAPAMAIDPTASARVVRNISDRAENLLASSKELSSTNVATVLKDELGAYQGKVKSFYAATKNKAVEEVPSSYQFDYENLAIRPLLDKIESKITNPTVLEAFKLRIAKARLLGTKAEKTVTKEGTEVATPVRPTPLDATGERILPEGTAITLDENLRSFENLLELRQTINNFKFNKKLSSAIDRAGIDHVLSKIDKEISTTTGKHLTNASAWKTAWKKANVEYAKMFALEENILAKALQSKGMEPKQLVKQLSNKITSPDGTFMQLISKLPQKARVNMEGAVLDHLTNKFTAGLEGQMRATHFPMLAKELDSIAFYTPEARQLKRVVKEMSEVWRNDVNLAKASGNISIPKFQSFLTVDPVMRAKYEFASSIFNGIKRLAPTQKGRALALVTKTGKVLENPLNAKDINSLVQSLGEDPAMADKINELAITYAKFGQKDLAAPKVKIYRAATDSTKKAKTTGELGKGVYYGTEHKAAAAQAKGKEGVKVVTEEVHPHRIADSEAIKQVTGLEEITPEAIRGIPGLEQKLENKGFLGFNVGDKVILFK
jgi:hypothetical protein